MKLFTSSFLVILLVLVLVSCDKEEIDPFDRLIGSYAFEENGVDYGESFTISKQANGLAPYTYVIQMPYALLNMSTLRQEGPEYYFNIRLENYSSEFGLVQIEGLAQYEYDGLEFDGYYDRISGNMRFAFEVEFREDPDAGGFVFVEGNRE